MSIQLSLFDLRVMLDLQDSGSHLDAGVKSKSTGVCWPGLACDRTQFVWYTLLTRSPYTADMLERRLERERAAFVADVLSEAQDILREPVYG